MTIDADSGNENGKNTKKSNDKNDKNDNGREQDRAWWMTRGCRPSKWRKEQIEWQSIVRHEEMERKGRRDDNKARFSQNNCRWRYRTRGAKATEEQETAFTFTFSLHSMDKRDSRESWNYSQDYIFRNFMYLIVKLLLFLLVPIFLSIF